MNIGRSGIVAVIFGIVLWGEAAAEAKEQLPKPTESFVTAETALAKYAEGASWFSYNARGGLTYHWCEGAAAERLRGSPVEVVALVQAMVRMPEVTDALEPWREQLRSEIYAANAVRQQQAREQAGRAPTDSEWTRSRVPIDIVNAIWQARVTSHAPEIAQAIPTMATAAVQDGSCTTGPWDCTKLCKKGHTCDCQLYVEGSDNSSVLMRDACTVDIGPDPRGAARVVDLGLGN